MPVAVVGGIRLNFLQLAPETGAQEDLVLVHGLATNLAFWYAPYATELSRRYRVTLFDLRGHGRSEAPATGYRPVDLARDLRGLLDHLSIRRAHFLAHSFGGVVALKLACADPERVASLVVADTHIAAARGDGASRAWADSDRIQKILDDAGVALDVRDPYFGYKLLTEVALLQKAGATVPPALAELVAPWLGARGNRTAMQWLALMEHTSAKHELTSDDGLDLSSLRRLRFPILALYGDRSQARFTGEELLNVWPHAEFRRVRDAGHFFPTTRAAEVLRSCRRFWDGEFPEAAPHRSGEADERHFRSDRIYESSGSWYCRTRESTPLGPFPALERARHELAVHIASRASAAAVV
ncbi:MAG TPA: alpha/beta fold hydrolase [Caldimonas sp.]|jgi:pimeloyl-ACP methyl ester carboxylesterase